MPDIDTTQTFADGDTVTGAKLNLIIDGATIQPGFISGKTPLIPEAAEDYFVFLDTDSGTLKKCLVNQVPGVASVAMTSAVPGTSVTVTGATGPAVSITLNQAAQSGNKVLAAPVGGASGLPTYRHLVPKDKVTSINLVPAFQIDWSISDVHYKGVLPVAGNIFSFIGGTDGQTIIVEVAQAGPGGNATVAWPPGVRWENGVVPVLSQGAGRIDFFQFWFHGSLTFGKRILTNAF